MSKIDGADYLDNFAATEDSVYSNCDHRLNQDIVKELKGNKVFAQHAAWNFCGYIWQEDNKYYEQVWVYNVFQQVLSNDNIEDLIEEVNSQYGHD